MHQVSIPRLLTALALAVASAGWAVQGEGDPPPKRSGQKEYDAEIRYRIVVGRNERIAQYRAMIRYLESIGFVVDPNQEYDPRDPDETRLLGTVRLSADDCKLFFREPHIQALLLIPKGTTLPADQAALVKVDLELAAGLPTDRQRGFADQVRARLSRFGFKEAIGYDHRGHSRLLGLIPAKELQTLLGDLRWQPSGWLGPRERVADIPAPLRDVSPIRVVEVLAVPENGAEPRGWGSAPDRVAVEPKQKLSPELRNPTGEGAQAQERLELFLAYCPGTDYEWRRTISRIAPGLVIEGRLGTMLTVLASSKDLLPLAQSPIVSGIRRPRPAVASHRPSSEIKGDNVRILQSTGLSNLHSQGSRGQRVKVAVIDGDFRGWEALREKQLPANTRYLDVTAERTRTLEPDPFPGDAGTFGSGTQCALALALAAPDTELTLIRIDPAAPHQLDAVARLIRGEEFESESLAQRNAELRADGNEIRRRRHAILEERKQILSDYRTDDKTLQRRQEHFQRTAELESTEKAWHVRQNRYIELVLAERELGGIQIVSSSLVWESGYPLYGDSPLTRFFSDRPPSRFLWFQAAGNSRGQSWAGLFRDADGNGVMEFAPRETHLPKGRWTRELNSLAWQPHDRDRMPELPEKTRLRLSAQWREPHDPSLYSPLEDHYRRPLADLRLVVLRQRDPDGKQVGVDEFDVIARSEGLGQRIDNQPSSATYEQVVEFTPEAAGRYAVRIEGRVPDGIRPPSVPSLPAQRQGWELWPRLHIEAADAAPRLVGRPVLLDFSTDAGSLGVPADAQGAYTVGAVNGDGNPQPYSSLGPPLGRELLRKPNLFGSDGIAMEGIGPNAVYGSELAAPFAAGISAAMLSSGVALPRWEWYLGVSCGQSLRAP